ncbi:hypothetical protein CRUP_017781 [Coryphaenoides rupestris]|nr:hypothetical protein CRUP_018482 [Coryphaenoides rupestris]KAG7247795.1 hypothetical protein CRUP_017781 [Coryphaenoides rupestris]
MDQRLETLMDGMEAQQEVSHQIAALFRKYCPLLEKISFVDPCDVYRLLDAEAMMINSALLANRRSIARLQLHLLEDVLQKESVLRLRWQDRRMTWTSGRVCQEVERIRYVSSLAAVTGAEKNSQKNSAGSHVLFGAVE